VPKVPAVRRLALFAEKAASLAAIAGGMLILGVAALVVASVLGRWLLGKPIPADFELVEIGVGIAIFAFLSYTQLRGGHIAVDTFTRRLPQRVNAAIDGAWSVLLCAFLALFTWGLAAGAVEARQYNETLIQLPWLVWPVYAVAAILCALACLITACTALIKFDSCR
jgi:TRAP-type C4-dicarboxylate transport system permease small subunit